MFEQYFALLKQQRSKYHLTLGELKEALEKAIEGGYGEEYVVFSEGGWPAEFVSYRGYYEDLALVKKHSGTKCTLQSLLAKVEKAEGATFHGYKGGEYAMDASTPLWAVEDRCMTGNAVMELRPSTEGFTLVEKEMNT